LIWSGNFAEQLCTTITAVAFVAMEDGKLIIEPVIYCDNRDFFPVAIPILKVLAHRPSRRQPIFRD
jgi:hypothetical protein